MPLASSASSPVIVAALKLTHLDTALPLECSTTTATWCAASAEAQPTPLRAAGIKPGTTSTGSARAKPAATRVALDLARFRWIVGDTWWRGDRCSFDTPAASSAPEPEGRCRGYGDPPVFAR